MDISYKWIQEEYFDEKLPNIGNIIDKITLGAFEIEEVTPHGDDFVIDVDVLPNRAHDCLCHRGIAKEIGVILGLKTKTKQIVAPELTPELTPELSVKIEEPELCRRYAGRLVKGVKVGPSPVWLKERVESVGQRSINNIVDITNYLLLDIGQPLHVFDADKLEGMSIIVRKAKDAEKLTTLDDKDIDLDESILVIADASTPLAIAGVKGGIKAEVDENTTNIVIEVANFAPVPVRKTAQKIGIGTDASKRYENELSPVLVEEAMQRASQLILEIAGDAETKFGEIKDEYPKPQEEYTVKVTLEEVKALLGAELEVKEIADILQRFDFEIEQEANTFTVSIPPLRLDLRIKEDIIEEVGRIYGYTNIKARKLEMPDFVPSVNKLFYYSNVIKENLVDNGFTEVLTYTFGEKGELQLAKPMAIDRPKIRKSLYEGVKGSLELNIKNLDLLGLSDIRIFEIGHVFSKQGEHTSLAIAIRKPKGKKSKTAEKNLLTEMLERLSKKLGIELKGDIKEENDGGVIVEINLDEVMKELDTPDSYGDNLKMPVSTNKFESISPYPFMVRDIAVFVTGEKDKPILENILVEFAGDLLVRQPTLFDEYEKKFEDGTSKISYAYKLVFQSKEKTLTDVEVNAIMDKVYAKVAENKEWETR